MRQVSDDVPSCPPQDYITVRVAEPWGLGQVEPRDALVGKALHHLGCVVRTAVTGYQQLKVLARLYQRGLNRKADDLRTVIGRKNDADCRRQRLHFARLEDDQTYMEC